MSPHGFPMHPAFFQQQPSHVVLTLREYDELKNAQRKFLDTDREFLELKRDMNHFVNELFEAALLRESNGILKRRHISHDPNNLYYQHANIQLRVHVEMKSLQYRILIIKIVGVTDPDITFPGQIYPVDITNKFDEAVSQASRSLIYYLNRQPKNKQPKNNRPTKHKNHNRKRQTAGDILTSRGHISDYRD